MTTQDKTLVLRRKPGQRPLSQQKVCYVPADEIWWVESESLPGVWFLQTPLDIEVSTPFGHLLYHLWHGYATDFRSGPSVINPFIPKIGDIDIAICWIIHDVNYHGFISRQWADQILKDTLNAAGMSGVKVAAVYGATRLVGGSHYSQLNQNQGPLYNANIREYITFEWRPL